VAGHAPFAALLASWLATAAGAGEPRFSMTGTAAMTQRAPAQSSGRFELRGDLQRADGGAVAAPSLAAPSLAWGARFVIDASTAPASLVCYNDTIFRDAFDGNGL